MPNSRSTRPRRSVLPGAPDMRHLDTVDTCRMRLLALRTRIETDWPSGGRFLRRGHSLSPASETIISDLLVGLPTPLPMVAGGSPETLFGLDDTDLCCIAGRAVDAALVLLEGSNLDATYDGPWELPVIGEVDAPVAVLIRPDGHVAWVGGPADPGLRPAPDSGPRSPPDDPRPRRRTAS